MTGHYNSGISFALRTFIHLAGAVNFCYALYYGYFFAHPLPSHTAYDQIMGFGGKFQFLTVHGALIQALYYSICLVNDVFGTNEISPRDPSIWRRLRDYIFASFAFPLAIFIGISSWTALMIIDRELILPESYDEFYPSWLNHMIHTNIIIFIVLELITTFRQYPSRKSGVTGLLLFSIGYIIWLYVIYFVSGRWVYPVMHFFSMVQQAGCVISLALVCLCFYFIGEFASNKIWARELKQLERSDKKLN